MKRAFRMSPHGHHAHGGPATAEPGSIAVRVQCIDGGRRDCGHNDDLVSVPWIDSKTIGLANWSSRVSSAASFHRHNQAIKSNHRKPDRSANAGLAIRAGE